MLDSSLWVRGLLTGHHCLPVSEEVVDTDKVFRDLLWIEPAIQGALHLVLTISTSEHPGIGRCGLVIVYDTFGHHVEFTAYCVTGNFLLGSLLDVDRNATFEQFFWFWIDTNSVNDLFRIAQLF